jgi:hypothetical protein
MSGILTGLWNEFNHPRPSRTARQSAHTAKKEAKKDKEKKDREAKLAALEDAQKKEQPMTDKTGPIPTSSELPDAKILQRMREMLIESTCVESTPVQLWNSRRSQISLPHAGKLP